MRPYFGVHQAWKSIFIIVGVESCLLVGSSGGQEITADQHLNLVMMVERCTGQQRSQVSMPVDSTANYA